MRVDLQLPVGVHPSLLLADDKKLGELKLHTITPRSALDHRFTEGIASGHQVVRKSPILALSAVEHTRMLGWLKTTLYDALAHTLPQPAGESAAPYCRCAASTPFARISEQS